MINPLINLYSGPAAPTDLRAEALSDTSASLEWLPGDNSVIDRYYIRWSNLADQTDAGEAYSSITSYEVTGLQTGATYRFNVAAINRDGSSPFSETASLTLTEPQPGNVFFEIIKVFFGNVSNFDVHCLLT